MKKAVVSDFAHVLRAEDPLNPVDVALAASGPSPMELVLIIAFSLIPAMPKISGSY